jgi:very-short-patch-repair endonuclease
LWRALSGRRLGTSFRRQVPVGTFIADFLAPRERLIVEVDGGCHARRSAADARRDRKLRRWGYRVLRLDSEQVLGDVSGAVRLIRAALRE